MSYLRKRSLSAMMALLFVSMAMPGCLSMVIGRELLEGARDPVTISDVSHSYDLSHVWQNQTAVDEYRESKMVTIPIDHTVEQIIINFQASIYYDDITTNENVQQVLDMLQDAGIEEAQLAERYVEVWLYPCDSAGIECGEAIYHEYTEKTYPQNRTTINADENPFSEGTWRLEAVGQGVDATIVPVFGFQDSWTLRVSVIRPCVVFPESPDDCTPTVEFE
ncbi:MAG: hypothetical protein VX627_02660 [Candidatus Thermoplasmatota archaeon]|nr:hypothetical protein [Candidatus Thermoplasmatota archaeon]